MARMIATGTVSVESGESTVVARAQQGDAGAFEELVVPRLGRLLRLTGSILSNDADASDAVQETCIRAWRELPRLREPAKFEAWLWQIAINTCRTALRTRRRTAVREIAVETMGEAVDIPDPGRLLGDVQSDGDVVRRAFRRLDPDERAILVLHHIEDRSIAEIAVLLRIPEGTAKWRLYAARQGLQAALEAERR
ncbi:MAG: RNA polymerase sigma factor [Chloroflexota bacterium]